MRTGCYATFKKRNHVSECLNSNLVWWSTTPLNPDESGTFRRLKRVYKKKELIGCHLHCEIFLPRNFFAVFYISRIKIPQISRFQKKAQLSTFKFQYIERAMFHGKLIGNRSLDQSIKSQSCHGTGMQELHWRRLDRAMQNNIGGLSCKLGPMNLGTAEHSTSRR